MDNFSKGIVAGFIATVLLSILMLMKSAMGMLPALNVIQMQTQMLHSYIGTPAAPVVGWISHFIIGTVVWGGLFGAFNHSVPGRNELVKGMVFSVAAWLLMMFIVMPMAGAGFFGHNIGVMAPVATLVLHLIFGAVMGYSYAKLLHIPATQNLAAVASAS